ncbi:hypothetical protein KJ673_01390 [Patescibacteria group bacterium]|nr:hypothetical protein [Patescibacteria group bacterium]MCG2687573.1 hypothetical protein [Candidatus Parcubacteria bacterium]
MTEFVNWMRTLWLIFYQGMRRGWRDAVDDLMVDECEECARDLSELICSDYVDDTTVKRSWLKFMRDHKHDSMFAEAIGGIIADFSRRRPELMEECMPSEAPPRLLPIKSEIGDVDEDDSEFQSPPRD